MVVFSGFITKLLYNSYMLFAVFDQNKNFISFSNENFGGGFLFKEIPQDQSDLLKWRWEGNYDNGGMVSLENSSYEEDLSTEGFKNKYPLPILFSILMKQIFILSEKLSVTDYSFQTLVKDFLNTFENTDSYVELLQITNKLKRNEKET